MNMMDSRKFRRKRKPLKVEEPLDDLAPLPPLESREDRLARRESEEAENMRLAEELRLAEEARLAEEHRQAEVLRQEAEARAAEEAARLEAEARREADARRREEAERRAAAREAARLDAAARIAAERDAEEQARREAEEQARREADALALLEAEQARVAAEARDAEEQALRDAEEQARVEAAAAARQASKQRRIEEARQAEERRLAEQAIAAREARLSAAETTRRTLPPLPLPPSQRHDPWRDIPEMSPDLAHLNRNRIITADRLDPAHTTFDVLRTRLMHALNERGWKRVAITSPGKDCGKTFTTANLAISLSRQENARTLVMDFDMRRPSLHEVMGVASPGALGDVLRGTLDPEEHFLRMGQNRFDAGRNIAFALNTVTEPYASELLQDPRTARALDHLQEAFQPDVMLFDLPPALFYDDVIAFQPLFDGVLLVVGGGLTTEKEIKEVERRLGTDTPLLGMVLNKAEGTGATRYTY